MKRLCQLALAAALLAVPITAQAQCCGYGYANLPAYALLERTHPQENLFPHGGWTLYPGEAGSGVPSLSHYSHVYGVVPPAVAAAGVLQKLQMLGIPTKTPEPQFLDRNPRIADNVDLPTPRGWLPKDEEKDKNGNGNNNEPPPTPRPRMKDKDKEKNNKDKEKNDTERLDPPTIEKDGK